MSALFLVKWLGQDFQEYLLRNLLVNKFYIYFAAQSAF